MVECLKEGEFQMVKQGEDLLNDKRKCKRKSTTLWRTENKKRLHFGKELFKNYCFTLLSCIVRGYSLTKLILTFFSK